MNIMKKLTLIHLKKNKKRTLVTMFGIIISVAMITAVGSGYSSIINYFKEYSIAQYGRWHAQYQTTYKDAKEILKDTNVESSMMTENLGYANLEGSVNIDKPYVYVQAFERRAFNNLALSLVEGRYPMNENELVISEHIISNAQVKYKVGDKVKFNLGERYPTGITDPSMALNQSNPLAWSDDGKTVIEELKLNGQMKQYTIVGIIERPGIEQYSAPGYTVLTCLDKKTLTDTSKVNLYVFLKKVSSKALDAAKNANAIINYNLTGYYGYASMQAIRTAMIGFSVILMLIIMGGSISLIYNAFAISATDRSKQFGLLASVGATRKQKRNAVLFEAFVMSIISIPIGIISGIVGLSVAFLYVQKMFMNAFRVDMALTMYVSKLTILVAVLLSGLTIFISAWLPAKRASKMSPIEAIRGNHDVKLTKKKVSTSKLNRMLFGFEGELAMKNMKRNKKQYRSLIISLAITFVLFTSVSTFTFYIQESYKNGKYVENFDIEVSKYTHGIEDVNIDNKAIYHAIKEMPQVDQAVMTYRAPFDINVNSEESRNIASSQMKKLLSDQDFLDAYGLTNENFNYYVDVVVMENDDYETYLETIGSGKVKKVEGADLQGILLSNQYIANGSKRAVFDTIDLKAGDKFSTVLDYYSDEGEKVIDGRQINLGINATTDKYPSGYSNRHFYWTTAMLVVSVDEMEAFYKANKEIEHQDSFNIFMKTSTPNEVEMKINDILKENDATGICQVLNMSTSRKRDQSLLDMLNVFIRGFVCLITLICIANLCNTISTSFQLRRREFAMLKSVGMDPKKYNRMIRFESIFYGLKAVLYGIPISVLIGYAIYRVNSNVFEQRFVLPLQYFLYGALGIFVVILIGMRYASVRINKENVIDGLRMQ